MNSNDQTVRLYYDDCYARQFRARIVSESSDGNTVYLDRTAFYPASGGQPSDRGRLGGSQVLDVRDENGRIAHLLDVPLGETGVIGDVDWVHRFDHMQQHTGQHLLSAVWSELFGISTISFHMGAETSTVDLHSSSVSPAQMESVEARANELIAENRPVRIDYQESEQAEGLRKASGRTGMLRIVSIDGLDRSACGGTHVRATGEIGCILLRGTDKVRGNTRLEFLCGARAIRRARRDFETVSAVARTFSAAIDDTPELVEAQREKVQESEKQRRKLSAELASFRGVDLYRTTAAGAGRLRLHVNILGTGALDEVIKAEAQGFVSGQDAAYLAICGNPPSVLLAVSSGGGLHAGNLLKQTLSEVGGQGGGAANLAQGRIPAEVSAADFAHRVRAKLIGV